MSLERVYIPYAAKNGHLECLKYAYEHGCHWDEWTCKHAAKNDKWDCSAG